MNANSISVHNLRKRFPGFLLDDISFQVPCGRIVGFIGENGAGKSTTIKLILDQLRRDGGSIEIFGEDNTKYLQHGSIGVVYLLSFYMPSPSPLPISEMQIYMRFNPRYSFLFF